LTTAASFNILPAGSMSNLEDDFAKPRDGQISRNKFRHITPARIGFSAHSIPA